MTIQSSQATDLFINIQNNQLFIQSIATQKQTIRVVSEDENMTKTLESGEVWVLDL